MGAVPERLQSGHGVCESGWGAVTGGWQCGWGWCWGMGMPFWGRVSAVGGGRGVPPPPFKRFPGSVRCLLVVYLVPSGWGPMNWSGSLTDPTSATWGPLSAL